jgi:hypothetical protein
MYNLKYLDDVLLSFEGNNAGTVLISVEYKEIAKGKLHGQ